ncbi:methionine adenosyltransferase [Pseudoramibacter alactolyticus]|uniref:methionine adenosyltransferase n=1 Tax=Pseudoramibacter alactolyticus TaxID=113287 RepID=UPI00248E67FA|nr:methionine adenosyltransferase [Pseudoramibacter alactolyticus]
MKRTAESVTEGHPDKVCDQIADGILDACLKQDPDAHTAIEVMASRNTLMIAGELSQGVRESGAVNPVTIARQAVREIGYISEEVGLDADRCNVLTNVNVQSSDIAGAVSKAATSETPKWQAGKARCKWLPPEGVDPGEHRRVPHVGAGDQGVMIGYATDETPELMPMPFVLATKLAQRLATVRKNGTLPWLRPDGKSQVTMTYDDAGCPERIDSVVLSAQHDPAVDLPELQQALMEAVVLPVIDAERITATTALRINPSGRFVIGGPLGDTGLTGRKLMVDTYGSIARHGGGAFSGKDPTKVDRSGAYMARYVAKNIVGCGLAKRCEVSLAYAIGLEQPEMVAINTFGTARVAEHKIARMVEEVVSFSVADIIEGLQLRQPIYRETAAYGHFGRDVFPWEKVDELASVQK